MSKDFKEGFKEGFTLGTKLGYKLANRGCGSTDIEDLFQMEEADPMLLESDLQALGLGYKEDATKVDKKKYPKYEAGRACGNCTLFQGKAGDAAGGCPLFSGKSVSSKGWCSSHSKKT